MDNAAREVSSMKCINVYIVTRVSNDIESFPVKSINRCYDFNIAVDYLQNAQSSFTLSGDWSAEIGDILFVKEVDEVGLQQTDINIDEQFLNGTGIKPLYAGVIASFDDGVINTTSIYSIFSFEFAATNVSGTSWENHLINVIQWNDRLAQGTYLNNIALLDNTTNTPFSYQVDQSPTVTNIQDYIIDGFKKYNVVLDVAYVVFADNSVSFFMSVEAKTNTIQIKNNTYQFLNWSVYENNTTTNQANCVVIIDQNQSTPTNPLPLSTWYVDSNGTLLQSLTNDVSVPVNSVISLYDPTQSNPPTYLSVAQSVLGGINYSHEIDVDVMINNNFLTVADLQIGTLTTIFYNDTIYNSVLTGYTLVSGASTISLKFGNIRSTLKELFNQLK